MKGKKLCSLCNLLLIIFILNIFRDEHRPTFGGIGPQRLHPKPRKTAESTEDSGEHVTDSSSFSKYFGTKWMNIWRKRFKFAFLDEDVDSISGGIGGNKGVEVDMNNGGSVGTGTTDIDSDSDESDSDFGLGPFFNSNNFDPFLNNPFFNIFGQPGFAFGGPQSIPWWKG